MKKTILLLVFCVTLFLTMSCADESPKNSTTESTSEDLYENIEELLEEYNKRMDEVDGNFRNKYGGVGMFSYNGYLKELEGKGFFTVDPSTFKNTTETEVTTREKAIELAKNELPEDYEYDRIEVYYDKATDMWAMLFLPEYGVFGGGQMVFIDGKGITRLIRYGE